MSLYHAPGTIFYVVIYLFLLRDRARLWAISFSFFFGAVIFKFSPMKSEKMKRKVFFL